MANTQWEVSARLEDGGLRVLCTMTVVSCFQYCEVQRVEHKAAGAVYGGVFSTVTCSECCGRSPRVKRRSLLHSPFPPVKRSFHAREESKRPLACSKHARLPNRRFNSKQHQLTRHAHRQLPALSLSLLPPRRSFNSNSTRSQGMLTDGYRADSGGPAGYLPQPGLAKHTFRRLYHADGRGPLPKTRICCACFLKRCVSLSLCLYAHLFSLDWTGLVVGTKSFKGRKGKERKGKERKGKERKGESHKAVPAHKASLAEASKQASA
eukprot:269393-Pelagomonas_calceolata.AAC.1